MEKHQCIDEILAYLFWPDLTDRAHDALQVYRKDALAVAKLPIPKEVKEQRVLRLQDVLHEKLVALLKKQLSRLPGHRAISIQTA